MIKYKASLKVFTRLTTSATVAVAHSYIGTTEDLFVLLPDIPWLKTRTWATDQRQGHEWLAKDKFHSKRRNNIAVSKSVENQKLQYYWGTKIRREPRCWTFRYAILSTRFDYFETMFSSPMNFRHESPIFNKNLPKLAETHKSKPSSISPVYQRLRRADKRQKSKTEIDAW